MMENDAVFEASNVTKTDLKQFTQQKLLKIIFFIIILLLFLLCCIILLFYDGSYNYLMSTFKLVLCWEMWC